jgi:uncharacterized membrane-anchored protein
MTSNHDRLDRASGLTGSVMGFPAHNNRSGAVGEVHARPSPLLSSPCLMVQLAFITEGGTSVDKAVLANLSRQLGIAPPSTDARHHAMKWGKSRLYWERHTEFSTYLWECPAKSQRDSKLVAAESSPFGEGFSPPGVVVSAVRLEMCKWTAAAERRIDEFDPSSLCYSIVENGSAAVITDFRQDGDGLTRFLVLDKGLNPARAGALSQRLIEIENYRTLAMLGLPLAHSLSPQMSHMEDSLAALTRKMRDSDNRDSQALLENLTELAAGLEAEAASSLYRFGASRAYYHIVNSRLDELAEQAVRGYETLAAFLQRRVAPAMRTCESIVERQANLSRKLARATTLLRTWVDVDQERQNRDLLASMNRRAKLQLRLQQTVEGLSVAAVSYYVVGLIGYLAKGSGALGFEIEPEVVSAISVPVVVLAIWFLVRRIRQTHGDHEEDRKDAG